MAGFAFFGGGVAMSRFMASSKPSPCVVTSFALGIKSEWHKSAVSQIMADFDWPAFHLKFRFVGEFESYGRVSR
jgi:hypothetical protein